MLKTPATLIMIIFIIYLVCRVLLTIRAKRVSFRSVILRAIPFMLLALAPVVWYVFARNHSAIHYWFTNKACIVTALAGMCGLLYATNENEKTDEKNI